VKSSPDDDPDVESMGCNADRLPTLKRRWSMQRQKIMVVFILGIMGVSSLAMAEWDSSGKDTSVRRSGVSWNIAEDRKMENNRGIYEPEGMDKYMKRYFDQLLMKIDQLAEQNNRLEKKVDELVSKNSQALMSQKKNP
jgi:hypothetical protein